MVARLAPPRGAALSRHAPGRAIEVNPVENPWRWPDRVVPPAGSAYVDRTVVRPGMIVRPGPVIAALDELGWEWRRPAPRVR